MTNLDTTQGKMICAGCKKDGKLPEMAGIAMPTCKDAEAPWEVRFFCLECRMGDDLKERREEHLARHAPGTICLLFPAIEGANKP